MEPDSLTTHITVGLMVALDEVKHIAKNLSQFFFSLHLSAACRPPQTCMLNVFIFELCFFFLSFCMTCNVRDSEVNGAMCNHGKSSGSSRISIESSRCLPVKDFCAPCLLEACYYDVCCVHCHWHHQRRRFRCCCRLHRCHP